MYEVVVNLLQPYPLLLVTLGIALWYVWRRVPDQRRHLRCVWTAWVLLVLNSLPIVAHYAAGLLEWRFPRIVTRPPEMRVIVVLGGGVIPAVAAGDHDRMSDRSLYRALAAAELYHAGTRCPVLVSGGHSDPIEPEREPAESMAEFLRQTGVDPADLIVENRSRNTAENAAFSAQILKERGLDEGIVLVTSATHLVRAEHLFRRAGCQTTPVGCRYRTDECDEGIWVIWPKVKSALIQQEVFHELLGMLWLMVRGQW